MIMMSNEQFSNKPLNILKASLPFLPGTAQKFVSYYIKIEEFNLLCNNLNDELDNDLRACDNDTPPNPNDLVKAIKPYLNNSERELVDMFLNMTRALNMYTTYKSLPSLYNEKPVDTPSSADTIILNTNMADSADNSEAATSDIPIDFTNESQNITTNDANNAECTNMNSNNTNNGGVNIEMLKNMLSPAQRAMFDTYSAMLNNG